MLRQVVLLFGGESEERLVSTASAQNLAQALDKPICWYWAPDDRVFVVSAQELISHQNPFKVDLIPSTPARWESLEAALDDPNNQAYLYLISLHGGRGENGTVQQWLEDRHLGFTGPAAQACRVAFDKAAGKKIAAAAGLRVVPSEIVEPTNKDLLSRALGNFVSRYGKTFCKPLANGSSVGIFPILHGDEISKAADAIMDFAQPFLLEQYVTGTELTVGVMDRGNGPFALPCTEIRIDPNQVFSYDGKYLGIGAREITPAHVDGATAHAAQHAAVTAHIALGCEGYSRSDFIIDAGGPVFLETNTLPGLTKASLVPQQLAHLGVTMKQFVDSQLELAKRRSSHVS